MTAATYGPFVISDITHYADKDDLEELLHLTFRPTAAQPYPWRIAVSMPLAQKLLFGGCTRPSKAELFSRPTIPVTFASGHPGLSHRYAALHIVRVVFFAPSSRNIGFRHSKRLLTINRARRTSFTARTRREEAKWWTY